MKELIYKKVDELEDEMVKLLADLISYKAISPKSGGFGEIEKANFLIDRLKFFGFSTERIDAFDKDAKEGVRPNIIAKLFSDKDPTLWFLAHLDVVPEGDLSLWERDPFTPYISSGKIYGRGAEDNNQGIVSSIFSQVILKELGKEPDIGVKAIFVSDEECGSDYGIKYILKNRRDLFGSCDLFLIPDWGTPSGEKIEVCEKGILWIEFRIFGKQAHASRPETGINSFRAMSYFVCKLDSLYDHFSQKDELFDPPISTFEPTKHLLNIENVNTIPAKEIFCMDCRILPDISLDDVIDFIEKAKREIEKEFLVKIEYSFLQKQKPAPKTDVRNPLVRALVKSINDVVGISPKPCGIGGGTVAAHIREAGFPSVVWSIIDGVCHGPNEYCKIDNLKKETSVFSYLISSFKNLL